MALEGALQRAQPPVLRASPSTVDDRAALGLAQRDQAGADLRAVEQHGAGAAVAGVAADLGAGEPEIVAQHVGEARDGGAANSRTGGR